MSDLNVDPSLPNLDSFDVNDNLYSSNNDLSALTNFNQDLKVIYSCLIFKTQTTYVLEKYLKIA